jgi:hypothetical protein
MDLSPEAFARYGMPAEPAVSLGDTSPPASTAIGPVSKCSAMRVQIAGGHLMTLANHPSLTPIEQIYRKLPVNGLNTATPSSPFVIELGAFQVPRSMTLLLLDYRFDVYRLSGAVAGDFVPLENRRLSTVIGNDIVFSQRRTANLRYEVVPSNPSPSKEAFQGQSNAGTIPGGGPSRASQNQFDQARFQSQQSPTGMGLSMIPFRHRRDSALAMPFTYVVGSNQRVTLQVAIFQPLNIPIAFFEGEFCGLLLGANMLEDFLSSIAPCTNNRGQASP